MGNFENITKSAEESVEKYDVATFDVKGLETLTIMPFCPKCGDHLRSKDFDNRSGELTPSYDGEKHGWIDMGFHECECNQHLNKDEINISVELKFGSEFQNKHWSKQIREMLSTIEAGMTVAHKKNSIKIKFTQGE